MDRILLGHIQSSTGDSKDSRGGCTRGIVVRDPGAESQVRPGPAAVEPGSWGWGWIGRCFGYQQMHQSEAGCAQRRSGGIGLGYQLERRCSHQQDVAGMVRRRAVHECLAAGHTVGHSSCRGFGLAGSRCSSWSSLPVQS